MPTPDEIEAAARVICEIDPPPWCDVNDLAREALEAAERVREAAAWPTVEQREGYIPVVGKDGIIRYLEIPPIPDTKKGPA